MRKLYFKRFFDIQYLVLNGKIFTRYCCMTAMILKILNIPKILLDKWYLKGDI
jgi:hypothetical protein